MEAAAWISSVATVVLAVLTGFYVRFTAALSRDTKASAASAADAAASSAKSAEAASRSAAVAEAQVVVGFSVRSIQVVGDKSIVMLASASANVFVNQVEVKLLAVPKSEGDIVEVQASTKLGAYRVLGGDDFLAVLPRALTPGAEASGSALVHYKLDPNSQSAEARRVSFTGVPIEALDYEGSVGPTPTRTGAD